MLDRLHGFMLAEGSGSRAKWALANFGWLSFAAALALSLLGVYAIDLATRAEDATGLSSTAHRQLIFVGVGIVAAGIVCVPHYRLIGLLRWPLALVTIGLLIFLLLPFIPSSIVTPRNGTRGWIDLGPMDFQPSEVAKVVFVIMLAWHMRYRRSHRRFLGLVGPGLVAFVPIGLIMLQPDFGTAMMIVPALGAIVIAAGAKLRHIAVIALVAAMAAPASYPFLKPYQKERVVGLIRQIQGSQEGADDINYQSYTAQKVMGSGLATGNADDHARALIRYNRLPEAHNDMVYSVLVTRFGFWGGVGILGIYLAWLLGALGVAAMCADPFGRLLCVGLAALIAAQTIVNVGMNVGLVPIVGITLPFLSYGGSSIVAVWLTTGLVLGVGLRRTSQSYRPSFEYAEGDAQPVLSNVRTRPSP
ncbi:MAG: FtsW/RodA/SpoVE family cell cycle protein [Phycisphaera sp.]|nr:MAG: FtsW/RodA/SpoVE family cell cycle protein [Phycisphaera sp.]